MDNGPAMDVWKADTDDAATIGIDVGSLKDSKEAVADSLRTWFE